MKKVLILSMIIGGVALVSCKKDYNCSCTSTSTSGGNTATVTTDTTLADMKKADAEAKCNSWDASGSIGGSSWSNECELK